MSSLAGQIRQESRFGQAIALVGNLIRERLDPRVDGIPEILNVPSI